MAHQNINSPYEIDLHLDRLLRACFLSGARAADALTAWNMQVDWHAQLDPDSFRLLPQLARNLAAQGISHPMSNRWRGVARKVWYENQLLAHNLAPLFQVLREAKLEFRVTHGGAFVLAYDKDHVIGGASEFGLDVQPEQVTTARDLLERAGWQPQPNLPAKQFAARLQARRYFIFRNEQAQQVMLHTHFFPSCAPDTETALWQHAIPAQIETEPVCIPAPTLQLLHVCAQGTIPRNAGLGARVTDAMLLLAQTADQIDWRQFAVWAEFYRVVLPVRACLLWMQHELDAPVPPELPAQLQAVSISPREQRAFETTPANSFSRLWKLYTQHSCERNFLNRVAHAPCFMQHWWGLEHVWQVPASAAVHWRQRAFPRAAPQDVH